MRAMLRTFVRGANGSFAKASSTLRRFLSTRAEFIETCPDPSCACADTPKGLEVDRESKLLNTVSFHRRHIVVNTGDKSWPSRIEDDESLYATKVKKAFGKNGVLFDPRNLPLVSAASIAPQPTADDARLLLFPDFVSVPFSLPDSISFDQLINDGATQSEVDRTLNLLRSRLQWTDEAPAQRIDPEEPMIQALADLPQITRPTILICGHGARDERCGILGPLLQQQFLDALKAEGIDAVIGQITHIGGHKFAGNVIIYVPPSAGDTGNALAGKSIWYGRVEPRHCPGIVRETILGGRVVRELYRGSMAGAEP